MDQTRNSHDRQRRIARWAMGAAAIAVVACSGNDDGGTAASPAPAPAPTPAPAPAPSGIGPAGGSVSGPYGAQVIVPPGALSSTVDIAIARDGSGMPELPPSGVDTAGAPHALTPHGTAFANAATVRIPFDSTRIPTDADPVLYKAEPGGAFAPIATTIDNGMLVAGVNNFSWVVPGYASTLPRAVYALSGNNTVSSFTITRGSGALPAASASAPTGEAPASTIVHPSRRFLFVTNAGGSTVNGIAPNSITTYALDPVTGAVGPIVQTVVAADPSLPAPPVTAVVHPTGRFVYVINRDAFSSNANKVVSVFKVDATTGALSGPVATGDSGGAPPTAIAFDPSGEFAYVTYEFCICAPVGNAFVSTVQTYEVNRVTGQLVGPKFSAAAGDRPWQVVVDPSGKFAYVASISTDEVRVYTIDPSIGALAPKPGIQVASRPASLAIDPLGRFLYIAKQQPTFNMNLLVYRINASNGSLSFASGLLTGPGAEVGPIAVTAEPQGQFVYAIDPNGALLPYKVDDTGTLTPQSGPPAPVASGSSFGGIGSPWSFAASGSHPWWQDRCTHLSYWNTGAWGATVPPQGCMLTTTRTASSNAPSNNAPPPPPPSSFALNVSINGLSDAVGSITSNPPGIDYNPLSAGNQNKTVASFPTGTTVTLTASKAPNQPVVNFTWSNGCTGTGTSTNVRMNQDRSCTLTLQLP